MATKIKPPFGVLLRHGHPLARGLAGAWLFNEGRGDRVWDLSGAGHAGTLTSMDPATDWVGGSHGHALDFDGTNDRVIVGPDAGINFGIANACVVRCKLRSFGAEEVFVGHKEWNNGGYFLEAGTPGKLYYCANGSYVGVTHGIIAGDEVWLGVSRLGTSVQFYKNGVPLGSPQTLGTNNALAISAIGGYRTYPTGTDSWVDMRCDYVYCWSRPLSAGEMAWLYREPFGFLGRRIALPVTGFPGGTVHNVSGSATAVSSAGATATVTAASDLPTGRPWPKVTLGIEASWQREAILNGMTDTAMKLGTVLTQGWFWMRRLGCSAVYHGADVTDAASGPIVHVTAADTKRVSLPTYLPHDVSSTCCYLLRRFNSCGYQDRTTGAAVMVRIGPGGQLAAPAPNMLFDLKVEPTAGNRAGLSWFYCPLDQEAAPQVFHVYGDGGVGDVDFVHPLVSLPYKGRKSYRWQSQSLESGKYLFAVRAESAAGVESPPQATAPCEIKAVTPGEPGILEVEAV